MKYLLVLLILLTYGCGSLQPIDLLSESVGKTHFSHDFWNISLPGKWQHEDDEGVFIASSEGEQYAVYITVYSVSDDKSNVNWAAEEIKELKANKYQMEGYVFEFPSQRNYSIGDEIHYEIDGIDLKHRMRLFSKGILINKTMYTISFHDYDYSDQIESDKVLQLILKHLKIRT